MKNPLTLSNFKSTNFFLALFICFASVRLQAQNTKPTDQNQSAFSYEKTPVATATYGGLVQPDNLPDLAPLLTKLTVHNQNDDPSEVVPVDYDDEVLWDLTASYKKQPDRPRMFSTFNGNTWTGTPPDNSMAISNDGIIVSATNSDVYYFEEDGTELGKSTFNKLARTAFPELNDILYDPKVLYDVHEDRFILVFLHGSEPGNTHVLVFFSKTNNPVDGWHAYGLDGGEADENSWFDFPNIAVNKNELFITGNLFDFNNNPTISVIYQIGKHEGYRGRELNFQTFHSFRDRSGRMAFTVVPVERGRGTSENTYMDFVSTNNRGGDYLMFYTITGEIDDEDEKLESTDVTILRYSPGFDTPQKGSQDLLDGSDSRVRKAMYINGTIHVVHSTSNIQGNVAIMYNKFPRGRLSAITTQVYSESNFALTYPSIAAAGYEWDNENVMIAYCRAGANAYASVYAITVNEDMEASTPLIVKTGTGAVDIRRSGEERWGDYSTITRKYNTNACWVFACSGNASGNYDNTIAELSMDREVGVEKAEIKPASIDIFPNPTQESFSIEFELEEASRITISLLDIKSRNTETLLQTYQQSGLKGFTFNKGALNSGVYLLTVTNSEGQQLFSERLSIQ